MTYLGSAFLDKCILRYHKVLFFGTNKERARAKSCQPCTNTNGGGLSLLSGGGMRSCDVVEVGESFSEESHKNND